MFTAVQYTWCKKYEQWPTCRHAITGQIWSTVEPLLSALGWLRIDPGTCEGGHQCFGHTNAPTTTIQRGFQAYNKSWFQPCWQWSNPLDSEDTSLLYRSPGGSCWNLLSPNSNHWNWVWRQVMKWQFLADWGVQSTYCVVYTCTWIILVTWVWKHETTESSRANEEYKWWHTKLDDESCLRAHAHLGEMLILSWKQGSKWFNKSCLPNRTENNGTSTRHQTLKI